MKKLTLLLSFVIGLGVFATNAQEKKAEPKKPATEQTTKKPVEKNAPVQKKSTKQATPAKPATSAKPATPATPATPAKK